MDPHDDDNFLVTKNTRRSGKVVDLESSDKEYNADEIQTFEAYDAKEGNYEFNVEDDEEVDNEDDAEQDGDYSDDEVQETDDDEDDENYSDHKEKRKDDEDNEEELIDEELKTKNVLDFISTQCPDFEAKLMREHPESELFSQPTNQDELSLDGEPSTVYEDVCGKVGQLCSKIEDVKPRMDKKKIENTFTKEKAKVIDDDVKYSALNLA